MNKMSSSPIGEEILRKKLECSKQRYDLEVVFINPVDLASLLIDVRFQDVSYYAKKSSPVDRGEIGLFLGIKIVVSNNVPLHKLLYTINMGGYKSLQGPAWDKEKPDERVNPSRRDNE